MPKYTLPFTEIQRGWYEIEANSLEEAKQIVIAGDFTENTDPNYKDGITEWNADDLIEEED
jgi:hypothetical protein